MSGSQNFINKVFIFFHGIQEDCMRLGESVADKKGTAAFFSVFSYVKHDVCIVVVALTHYHTMPHFGVLNIYSCGKHCEKRRTCLKQGISPFFTKFSALCGTYFLF